MPSSSLLLHSYLRIKLGINCFRLSDYLNALFLDSFKLFHEARLTTFFYRLMVGVFLSLALAFHQSSELPFLWLFCFSKNGPCTSCLRSSCI